MNLRLCALLTRRNGINLTNRTRSFSANSMASALSSTGVSVHNEWDPIEEIIVGTSRFANFPGYGDKYFYNTMECDSPEDFTSLINPPFKFPERVIEETEEDIEAFVSNLKKLGIKVHRPEPIRFDNKIRTLDWEVEHFYCYCPRDLHLAIGNTIIECPSAQRSRYFETVSYHKIMYEYLAKGSRWISAPKGRLADSAFNYDRKEGESLLKETEMMFDAANVLRFGRDIMYLVSDSGNELGAKWLQSTLGSDYTVHCLRDIYSGIHIDTTMVALRPGLLLLKNSVDPDKLPPIFKKWEILKAPEPIETDYPASEAVDPTQLPLIKLLESRGIDVMPCLLRHGRVLGGGVHCITLDTRRTGFGYPIHSITTSYQHDINNRHNQSYHRCYEEISMHSRRLDEFLQRFERLESNLRNIGVNVHVPILKVVPSVQNHLFPLLHTVGKLFLMRWKEWKNRRKKS